MKQFLLAVFFFVGCLQPVAAAVDTTTEEERRYLVQLVRELQRVEELAQRAQGQADRDARMPFYYAELQRNVAMMKQAIVNHLDKPARTPRAFEPLKPMPNR